MNDAKPLKALWIVNLLLSLRFQGKSFDGKNRKACFYNRKQKV